MIQRECADEERWVDEEMFKSTLAAAVDSRRRTLSCGGESGRTYGYRRPL
jgi:hypothetical protein